MGLQLGGAGIAPYLAPPHSTTETAAPPNASVARFRTRAVWLGLGFWVSDLATVLADALPLAVTRFLHIVIVRQAWQHCWQSRHLSWGVFSLPFLPFFPSFLSVFAKEVCPLFRLSLLSTIPYDKKKRKEKRKGGSLE